MIVYNNVINKKQSINLLFYFNHSGECEDIEIIKFSDFIAPNDISFERVKRSLED
jgi:hypothetical protein